MDYSQLSDQEINIEIAKIMHPEREVIESKSRPPSACVIGHLPSKWVDYCNNPANAWPIIIENKISTMWMTSEKEWCAWAKGYLEEGTWDWENVPDYYFNCESQLRAAMIVFLMMQDAKHAYPPRSPIIRAAEHT